MTTSKRKKPTADQAKAVDPSSPEVNAPTPRPARGSGLSVVWKFEDGDMREPLEQHFKNALKEAQFLGALKAEREAKDYRAEKLREQKLAQENANYEAVKAAFLNLPARLQGRSATGRVCKATGLKDDTVRKHLKAVREERKAG